MVGLDWRRWEVDWFWCESGFCSRKGFNKDLIFEGGKWVVFLVLTQEKRRNSIPIKREMITRNFSQVSLLIYQNCLLVSVFCMLLHAFLSLVIVILVICLFPLWFDLISVLWVYKQFISVYYAILVDSLFIWLILICFPIQFDVDPIVL